MLTTIEANQKRQASGALFELAPVYLAKKQDLPEQKLHLLVAVYGPDGYAAFRQAKGILERLLREMGIRSLRLETGLNGDRWLPSRSALVWIGEHEPVGMVGQVGASAANAFGLDVATVLVELNFEELARHATTRQTSHPIPLYPEVKRDLAVVVDERAAYAKLEHELRATSTLLREIELFDIYRGKGITEGKKSLAMHLVFRADDRTLSAEEVEKEMEKLRDVLKKDFHAIVRS
jgi:phenylalanyl-tRNA synthetase beta chain